MFSSGPNYTKLKTHLRLSVNRLKLLEKKKTELAQKARKEIADYLACGKVERAKIRVEHIIREDYLVEAMEIVEMFCDLLLARFGLLTQMKELDSGIAEQVSSLIWVAPRLQADVQELKVISEILTSKYGKPFAESARTTSGDHHVSEKLMHKLAVQAPPKLLVEKYLIEIAKIYDIEYEPDPEVMKEENPPSAGMLIDLSDRNNLGGGSGGGFPVPPQPAGFIGYPQAPQLPPMPPTHVPFQYPQPGAFSHNPSAPPPFNYNIPPNAAGSNSCPINSEKKDLNINTQFLQQENHSAPPAYSTVSPDENIQRPVPQPRPPPYSVAMNSAHHQNLNAPKPQPRSKMPSVPNHQQQQQPPKEDNFPDLPNVPLDFPDIPHDSVNRFGGGSGGATASNSVANQPPPNDEIDFDDLSRRFEELVNRK